MKRALAAAILAAVALIAEEGLRFLHPPTARDSDPYLDVLKQERDQLQEYKDKLPVAQDQRIAVHNALWSAKQLDEFVTDLPKEWAYRAISTETQKGITFQRVAISKEMKLREYSDFMRILKALESHRGTRIDSITLSLAGDGKKFSAALVTATLPLAAQTAAAPAPAPQAAPAATAAAAPAPDDHPAPMPTPSQQ